MYWKLQEDPNWRLYCLMCRNMRRMLTVMEGFYCEGCHNVIDQDMQPMVKQHGASAPSNS